VATLVEPLSPEPGPSAVDLAAANPTAEAEHRRGVPVIRPAVSVLGDRAAEFRHRQDDHVGHAVAEVMRERGERGGEFTETRGQLTALGALRDVRVPAVHLGERDLDTDVRADELRDLTHRLAEGGRWIRGAVRR